MGKAAVKSRKRQKRQESLEGHIERRKVMDPAMSDAEFWHRKATAPDNPNIGLVEATVNMREMIGGFWRYKGRTEAQTMAAARFKSIYEACQLGGAHAANLEDPKVDTSFRPSAISVDRGDSARERYRLAVQHLGMRWSNLVEKVVIYDVAQRRIAKSYGYGHGGAGRRAVQEQVYAAMNALVEHFNL